MADPSLSRLTVPDYSRWPEITAKVKTTLLDQSNARIPRRRRSISQRELIAELVEHENVYDLARDIVATGFDPLESLLAIKEDGHVIVVEGNRRLTALKLLLDPTLAPDKHQRRFSSLAQRQSSRTTEVRVLVAPTRDATTPLVLRKHTRDQIERWSPLMQAGFYCDLLESGQTVAGMAARYGVTPSEIQSFLRLDRLYGLARTIDLPEPVRRTIDDPRQFSLSVLQRFIEVPRGRELLGLEFGPTGEVFARAEPEQFRRAFGEVLSHIATGRMDTRSLNKVSDAEAYIQANFSDSMPNISGRTYTAEELAGAASANEAPAGPAESQSKRRSAPSTELPVGLRCAVDDPRMKEILRELKKLKPHSYPNAHAVLFRVLLDLGVSRYLYRTGAIKSLLDGKKKGPDWSPALRDTLRLLIEDEAVPMTPPNRKAIRNELDNPQRRSILVTALDGFVHSSFEWPNERELRRLWRTFEPVFQLVLKEPPA